MKCSKHLPVMTQEVVKALNINPAGIYLDLTFGCGGHSNILLKVLGKEGRLLAFDEDKMAADYASGIKDQRFSFFQTNFCFFSHFLTFYKYGKVDGILADLGLSSSQLDHPNRGFSTRIDAPLDMRFNQNLEKNASYWINNSSLNQLENILRCYGEVRCYKKIARAIFLKRKKEKISTTFQLKEIIAENTFSPNMNRLYAQVFQAFRIMVNGEQEILREMLFATSDWIKKDGRLVVLSYHSLEDRLVKYFMRSGNFENSVQHDNRGNIIAPFLPVGRCQKPTQEEIKYNSRARSVRLRTAHKI